MDKNIIKYFDNFAIDNKKYLDKSYFKTSAMRKYENEAKEFTQKISFSKNLTEKFRKRIKGINFDIYVYDTESSNAITFFALDIERIDTPVTFFSFVWASFFSFNKKYYEEMKKFKVEDIKLKREGNNISVENWNYTSYVPIILYKSILNDLSEDELVAIILHELGHHTMNQLPNRIVRTLQPIALISFWLTTNLSIYNYDKNKGGIIDRIFKIIPKTDLTKIVKHSIVPLLFLIAYMLTNHFKEKTFLYREKNSDNFAKRAGFGKELATALKKMKDNVHAGRGKVDRILTKMIMALHKILTTLKLATKTHPDLEDRIKELTK